MMRGCSARQSKPGTSDHLLTFSYRRQPWSKVKDMNLFSATGDAVQTSALIYDPTGDPRCSREGSHRNLPPRSATQGWVFLLASMVHAAYQKGTKVAHNAHLFWEVSLKSWYLESQCHGATQNLWADPLVQCWQCSSKAMGSYLSLLVFAPPSPPPAQPLEEGEIGAVTTSEQSSCLMNGSFICPAPTCAGQT